MSFENKIGQKVKLLRSNQREDGAAMSIVNNKNSATIETKFQEYDLVIGEMVEKISRLEEKQLNQKILFDIDETVQHSESIESNEFHLTKYINQNVSKFNFMIVDLNSTRNTNFFKSEITIFDSDNKQILSGYEVISNEASIIIFLPYTNDFLPENKSLKILIS